MCQAVKDKRRNIMENRTATNNYYIIIYFICQSKATNPQNLEAETRYLIFLLEKWQTICQFSNCWQLIFYQLTN